MKADQVGKRAVAKEDGDSVPPVGLIQAPSITPTQIDSRLCQNAFIGGQPPEPDRRGQQRHVVGDRTFRWPETLRCYAEPFAHEGQSAGQLLTSIVGELD